MPDAAKGNSQAPIRNVLFATDLSRASAPATRYVLELARIYGGRIHVVHVKTGEWDRQQEQESNLLREQLSGTAHEFQVISGGPTALKERGDVATTVLGLVGTKSIDLIVVGTHGRSGFGRVLVGSVAETIVREAPCPVLTVGPRLVAVDQVHPFKINEVLYATDMTPSSEAAQRYALSLAQENHARLIILNVQLKPKTGELVDSERFASSNLRRLEQLIPSDAGLERQPYCVVEIGDPAEKILEVASENKADVIVLGVRPHSVTAATRLLQPTVHRVIAGATCPVLTVRGEVD